MATTRLKPSKKKQSASLAESRTAVVGGLLVLALCCTAGLLYVISPTPLQPDATRELAASETVQISTTPAAGDELAMIFDGINLEDGRWTNIQVRHSQRNFGNVATLAEASAREGGNGAPDHFVITNGKGGDDGKLFMTSRWDRQLPSIHHRAKNDTISICVVGDLTASTLTAKQKYRLLQLIDTLQNRTGAMTVLADSAVRGQIQRGR